MSVCDSILTFLNLLGSFTTPIPQGDVYGLSRHALASIGIGLLLGLCIVPLASQMPAW